jgi:hypothetical protein
MNIDAPALRRIRWELARWWHGPGARASVGVLAVCAALAAAVAWRGAQHARAERDGLAAQVAALRSTQAPPTVPDKAAATPADFTARLPVSASAAQALEALHTAAARTQVAMDSVQVQESPPAPDRLGRVELSVLARGGYADLKRWLAEVTERVPASTVARLQLQRDERGAQLQAQVLLIAWSRPAAAAAVASERR